MSFHFIFLTFVKPKFRLTYSGLTTDAVFKNAQTTTQTEDGRPVVQPSQNWLTFIMEEMVILLVSEARSLRTCLDEFALSTICSTSCLSTMFGTAGPIIDGIRASLDGSRNGPGSQDFFT